MAYTLPSWKDIKTYASDIPQQEYYNYPEPTGYITPTDAKRFLVDYATKTPGWNEAWRQYLPAISGFLEETISDPRPYMPSGMWENVMDWWFKSPAADVKIPDWAASNPAPTVPTGGYNYMTPNWWLPGQGTVGTYVPQGAAPAPDPKANNKYILQDMLDQGVAGRQPGNSNLGVQEVQLEPIKATEQPMQQFSVLNQWNTMPKWDMGAGPNWAGI